MRMVLESPFVTTSIWFAVAAVEQKDFRHCQRSCIVRTLMIGVYESDLRSSFDRPPIASIFPIRHSIVAGITSSRQLLVSRVMEHAIPLVEGEQAKMLQRFRTRTRTDMNKGTLRTCSDPA